MLTINWPCRVTRSSNTLRSLKPVKQLHRLTVPSCSSKPFSVTLPLCDRPLQGKGEGVAVSEGVVEREVEVVVEGLGVDHQVAGVRMRMFGTVQLEPTTKHDEIPLLKPKDRIEG